MIRRTSIHVGLGLLLGLTGSANVAHGDEDRAEVGPRRTGMKSPARQMAKLRRLQAQMPRELELDEEQVDIMTDIFDEYFEGLEAVQAEQREARRANADRVRELIQQLREARQSGDDQLAADLRTQITDLRTGGEDNQADYSELYDEIRAELDDDQIQKFDQMIARLDQPIRQSNRFDGVQRIRRAAESLDLEPEQQRDLRELFIKMQRDAREAGDDAEALQRVEESSIEAIKDLLYDDQIEPFEARLEELKQQQGRPGAFRKSRIQAPEPAGEQVEGVVAPADEPAEDDADD